MKFEKVSYSQFKKDYLDCIKKNSLSLDSKIENILDENLENEIETAIVQKIYDNIKLPKRATTGSAGYDFFAPVDINLFSDVSIATSNLFYLYANTIDLKSLVGKTILIPTGIRAQIDEGWLLSLYPRSGLGFKYRVQLDNTVGIIDSDYYFSSNEGHIMAKITIDSYKNQQVCIKSGQGFMQGIFTQYGLVDDDNVTEIRDGGFGSTTK